MNLSIDKLHLTNSVVCLAVSGEVDLASCEQLHLAIKDALADVHTTDLIIDLELVPILDSTGVRCLIEGRRLASARAAGYLVINPQELVYRVLQITGVLPSLCTPLDGHPPHRMESDTARKVRARNRMCPTAPAETTGTPALYGGGATGF